MLGQVIDGLEVLDRMEKAPTGMLDSAAVLPAPALASTVI